MNYGSHDDTREKERNIDGEKADAQNEKETSTVRCPFFLEKIWLYLSFGYSSVCF